MKTMAKLTAFLSILLIPFSSVFADELEDFADSFMIEQLMYRYALAHDLTEPETYADLFTEDGALVSGGVAIVKGREALIAQTQADREKYNPGAKDGEDSYMVMRHIITNPVITLHGDGTASGICYSQIVVQKPGVGPQILAQGRYEDEYVKVNGKWLFLTREIYATDMANFELAAELGIGG